jgi:hypothetical protein
VNRGAYLPWAKKLAVFSVCLWCQKVTFEMIELSHETWLFWDRPGMQELEPGGEGFENAKNTPLAARHTPLICIKTGLFKQNLFGFKELKADTFSEDIRSICYFLILEQLQL